MFYKEDLCRLLDQNEECEEKIRSMYDEINRMICDPEYKHILSELSQERMRNIQNIRKIKQYAGECPQNISKNNVLTDKRTLRKLEKAEPKIHVGIAVLLLLLLFAIIPALTAKYYLVKKEYSAYNKILTKSENCNFNYTKAFKQAVEFYDANKCGNNVEEDNVFPWRKNCHLEDGKDVGLDLTGGFHDAGDHIKFGLAQAYTASVLGWIFYEYRDVFDKTGNSKKLTSILKHFSDYFLKCHPKEDVFYYQIGDGTIDHMLWDPPEKQKGKRPTMYFADKEHPASDVLGMTSAALTLMYLNYKDIDGIYAEKCLQAALNLYNLGKTYRGLSHGQTYYKSTSYIDDLVWAAIWLYIAKQDNVYLQDIQNLLIEDNVKGGYTFAKKNTMSWQYMYYPSFLKLWDITGDLKYKKEIEFIIYYSIRKMKSTEGGLIYFDEWAPNRYSANLSLLCMMYFKRTGDESAKNLAISQINYILGNNPMNMSYVIGFGERWPKHPHHRAANGHENGLDEEFTYQNKAKHLLLGALVGGPDLYDNFSDDVSILEQTEVAIDYNAGFIGALAGILSCDDLSNK